MVAFFVFFAAVFTAVFFFAAVLRLVVFFVFFAAVLTAIFFFAAVLTAIFFFGAVLVLAVFFAAFAGFLPAMRVICVVAFGLASARITSIETLCSIEDPPERVCFTRGRPAGFAELLRDRAERLRDWVELLRDRAERLRDWVELLRDEASFFRAGFLTPDFLTLFVCGFLTPDFLTLFVCGFLTPDFLMLFVFGFLTPDFLTLFVFGFFDLEREREFGAASPLPLTPPTRTASATAVPAVLREGNNRPFESRLRFFKLWCFFRLAPARRTDSTAEPARRTVDSATSDPPRRVTVRSIDEERDEAIDDERDEASDEERDEPSDVERDNAREERFPAPAVRDDWKPVRSCRSAPPERRRPRACC